MKLTKEHPEEIIKKLSKFFKNSCQVCSGNEWILNERVFELREFEGGKLIIGGGGNTFPVLAVACKSCGNTYFFNAIILKIIDKDNDK